MADRTVAMMHTPMSPLDSGPSDDLLAVLDEILDFTPKEAASTDSLAQQALEASYIADAFEFPEVPNPYEQQPVEEPKPALLEAKVEQTATFVPIVTKQPAQRQKQQHQSAQRKKDVCTMTCPTPKRRRKRPKDELDYLRAKVAGLEEELACLNRSTGRFSSISDIEKEMFARWKLIAERQKEEANRTIVENMKLRTMLKAQFEIAKRRQMMMAEYHQQTMPQSLPWNFIKTEFNFFDVEDVDGPRVPSISDETIFAQLNGSLEAQYAQVSSVLQANGIADVNRELLGKIHLKQNMNGISFGIHEVRLVPFAMQSVERIMWSLVGDKISEVPGRTQIINNNHQNFKIGNTLEFPKSQHTKTSSRFAMRRYFEGNRIIFVWSACVEIAGSVFVRLREKGCVTISSFNLTGSELSRCEGSILRCVIDVEPETVKFSTGADPKKNIKEMTDLVLAAYNRRFDTFNQLMESLLLQDLRASSA